MIIEYSEEIYPREVVIKAAFKFLDQAYIHIDKNSDKYIVSITEKDGADPITKGEFDNEMLAQSARYVVSIRTKAIREITLGNYADLVNAYGNDLKSYYLHYKDIGKAEGRIGYINI